MPPLEIERGRPQGPERTVSRDGGWKRHRLGVLFGPTVPEGGRRHGAGLL